MIYVVKVDQARDSLPSSTHPATLHTHTPTTHTDTTHTHKHIVKCVRDNNHHALWFYVDKTSATFGYTGSASTPTPTKSTGGLDRRAGQPFTDFAERIMGGAGMVSPQKGVAKCLPSLRPILPGTAYCR